MARVPQIRASKMKTAARKSQACFPPSARGRGEVVEGMVRFSMSLEGTGWVDPIESTST